MGFLYGLCNQLRNGPSAITPLTKEEKIENHFMKGKGGTYFLYPIVTVCSSFTKTLCQEL